MKELHYLNKYFIKYKYRFLFGIIITIVAQIFALYTPELVGKSISLIEAFLKSECKDTILLKNELFKNIALIIFCTLIAGFLTFLMRQTLIVMSRFVEFDLKNEIFNHYQNLSQNFYKKNRTGDLMNRISEDVGKVRMYVGPAVMYTINTIIRFVAIIISMSAVNVKLTIYCLLPLPILSYSIFVLSKRINKKSTEYQENLSTLSSFTQEFFSGIRVIKAYALENDRNNEFIKLSEISKELHDNIGQIISVAIMQLNICISSKNVQIEELKDLKAVLAKSLDELRILSRIINKDNLLQSNFIEAIKQDLERVKKLKKIHYRYTLTGEIPKINEEHDLFIYRIFL